MSITLQGFEEENDYGHMMTNYYCVDSNGNKVNVIRCGDTITTDLNGRILTVNGELYVHVLPQSSLPITPSGKFHRIYRFIKNLFVHAKFSNQ